MTSPWRSSARSPSLSHRKDSPPWMKPCRAACCVSPASGAKEEEGFPTTLPTTRSARWSTRRPGMPAGASSIAALTVLEYADTPTAMLAYYALARGLPDRMFRWYKISAWGRATHLPPQYPFRDDDCAWDDVYRLQRSMLRRINHLDERR